jgi:hypothetical protein
MRAGFIYKVLKGYVMKKVNKRKGLVLLLTSVMSLAACSDKVPPAAEQQIAPDENLALAEKPLNSFPKSDYVTRNIQDDIIYVVMPEKFQNANKASNELSDEIETKLNYIEGLGVTALQISPVLHNKAIQNSEDGPSIGNKKDLKRLIEAAHSRNIKIFFDITFSESTKLSNSPLLDEVTGLTDAYKSLITEYKPDGFSINNVNKTHVAFWQSFAPAITEHAQNTGLNEFILFGKVLDGKPIEMSQFTSKGQLPSMLDSNFSSNIRDVIFGNNSVNQLSELFNNDDYYRDSDSSPNALINFIGNNETGRIADIIDSGLPSISVIEKANRSKVAHALMYFSRGIPTVYQGDEQDFTGAQFELDGDNPFYTYLSDLAKVRHAHESLRSGEHLRRIIDEEKSLYGFSRIIPNDMIDHLVVFNLSSQQQQTSIGVGFLEYEKLAGDTNSKIELSGDQLMIDLPPLSYIVLKSNIPLSKSRVLDIQLESAYEESERVYLSFDLTFSRPEQFNFAQLNVYAIDQDGQKTFLAFDTTAPYRAILLPEQFEKISQIEVKADNFKGQTKTKVFDLSMQ